jgi:hypothetical protein
MGGAPIIETGTKPDAPKTREMTSWQAGVAEALPIATGGSTMVVHEREAGPVTAATTAIAIALAHARQAWTIGRRRRRCVQAADVSVASAVVDGGSRPQTMESLL